MSKAVLSAKVSDALVAEINEIGGNVVAEGDTPVEVEYTPQAWTRQGHVD